MTRARSVVAAVLALASVTASCGDGPAVGAPAGGTWRAIPAAPIETRPFAVSGWSGAEAVFWAGANLRRNFAHTDGAAFDPATDSWRVLPVPGWGHPGLTGAPIDDALYVAAKGGTSRIDLSTGADLELPQVPGFVPATMVATDDGVWAVGPENFAEDLVRVGIARYDFADEVWVPGPAFAGGSGLGELFQDEWFTTQPVLWTGKDIVVWAHDGHGLSFDVRRGEWRVLPPLVPPDGSVRDSRVAVAGPALAVLALVGDAGTARYGLASWDGAAWEWRDVGVDLADFGTVTVAGAGDWIVVFRPEGPPYSIHVPTGEATRHDGAPVAAVQAPNAVWTGDELVVWGGAPVELVPGVEPVGAVWTPPGG